MSVGLLTVILFGSLAVGLFLGLPISFVMGGIGIAATWVLWGPDALLMAVTETFGWMSNFITLAIPLYIFMGILLERAGIAERLFEMVYRWAGSLRGGLAIGVLIICTIFAAMTGITAAATVAMGIIALPAMLNRGYDKGIAIGSIISGGTLAILIPPSVPMVIFSMITQASVGGLYAGGIVSGLFLSALMIGYIGVRAYLQPQLCPVISTRYTLKEKVSGLLSVIAPIFLIVAVVGSIFAGVATPTEGAALGAVGALLCAFAYRTFSWQLLKDACYRTVSLSSMVMWIIIGSSAFIRVYTALGCPRLIQEMLAGLTVNRWVIIIIMMFIVFVMGCFLDPGGIIMLAGPIFAPVVVSLGFDLTWFGILFIINLQMGYLTPPFGMNLFYMKSVAPKDVSMDDIIRCIIPFLLIMGLSIVVITVFPQIALWLPGVLKK